MGTLKPSIVPEPIHYSLFALYIVRSKDANKNGVVKELFEIGGQALKQGGDTLGQCAVAELECKCGASGWRKKET